MIAPFPFHRILRLLPVLLLAGCRVTAPPSEGGGEAAAALDGSRRVWCRLPGDRILPKEPARELKSSLHEVLDALVRRLPLPSWTGTREVDGWMVTFNRDGPAAIDPSVCDVIQPVPALHPHPGLTERVESPGAGLPVIMIQRPGSLRRDPFLPPNGRWLPATLTAEFTGSRAVTLTFHNTREVARAVVHGKSRILASDLSSPIASAMAFRYFGSFGVRGLFHPATPPAAAGIYLPEPFDPARIPVVFIHGITSAPFIWGNAMNTVAADPALRRRYQCWYYLYPTGNTVHESAAGLRRSLRQVREYYDPQHRSGAMDRMVLVGHSMGGLISRMQVVDSRRDFYRAFFQVPEEKLGFSRKTLGMIRDTLVFERQPAVKRLVFVCVPHQGTEFVDRSLMRMVTGFIRPTEFIQGFLEEGAGSLREALNPGLLQFRMLGTRSTETLSPHHPLLAAINAQPVPVPFHNIIALFPPVSAGKPLEAASDGVVSYASAWLPGAESTTTVSAFHSCAAAAEVCREIARILRLHAAEMRGDQDPPG